MKPFLSYFFIFLLHAVSYAQINSLDIQLNINDEDGVVYESGIIQPYITIHNRSSNDIVIQMNWSFETDDWQLLKEVSLSKNIKANSSRDFRTTSYPPFFEFKNPGFYRISVKVTADQNVLFNGSKVVGFDPEKIITPLDKEPDFNAFWENSIQELAKIAPEYRVTPIPRKGNTKTDLFKVEMKTFGGLMVMGYLEVPRKKGKYPALIRVPGYQSEMKPIDKYNDMIIFSFNPRDHGESDDGGERNYEMWLRGLHSKESYYYRGMYLDCIRAVDYISSRSDVDQNRIAIWGGSQGGGLSFSTAALDSRIDLCIADIPFLCEWQKYFEITHWDELDDWFNEHPNQNWKTVLKTFSYFDTKNMAQKIQCPIIMGIGLQDDVCPPSTSFATYNRISSTKEFTIYKNEYHSQPDNHYTDRFRKIRKLFNLN